MSIMQDYIDYFFPGPKYILINENLNDEDNVLKDSNNESNCYLSKKKSSSVYFLNPFDISNTAFVASYFNIGIAMALMDTPVTYYLVKTLGISATQLSAYKSLMGIPWSLKFISGMISDSNPILRYKRKSWFTIGWLGFIGVSFLLANLKDLTLSLVIGLTFLQSIFYMLADVVSDTMAIERSRFEKLIIRGSLQTSCYTIRAFGMLIGSLLGALLYNIPIWGWGLTLNELFLLSALIPLITIIPYTFILEELITTKVVPNLQQQISKLWEIVQLRAVYQTIGYIYFYGIFQIPNGGFSTFLIHGLNFTDFEFGMLSVSGFALAWIGVVLYRSFFFNASFRQIFIYTTILGTFFSFLQVILILQLNIKIGIPNFYFALGDSAIVAVIMGIQFIPSAILFGILCPEGYEGLVFAILTTINNLSGSIASNIGSVLTLVWDVSNNTIGKGDYSGVLKLAILTSSLQLFPLCLVWLLPDSR
jgi:MFS family permease